MTTNQASTTETELASRLRLAIMRLARRLRQQTQDPVTPSQISTLVTIEHAGSITLGELASRERVQPPTMTRIVAALEEASYVVRTVDAADRRIARMTISAEGARLLERSRRRKNAYLVNRLRGLTAEDVETLDRAAAVLEKLVGDEG